MAQGPEERLSVLVKIIPLGKHNTNYLLILVYLMKESNIFHPSLCYLPVVAS